MIAIALSFGVSGCVGGNNVTYRNEQNVEDLDVEQRQRGTIDIDFKVPPTLEPKASAKIDGISKIIDIGNTGVLVFNADNTQLYRVSNGQVVWSSDKTSQKITNAQFVQEGDRPWIVATRQNGAELEVAVYDAFAAGANQIPLRKKSVKDGKSLIFQDGTMIADSTGVYRFYAQNGLMSKVNLPGGSTLLAPTNLGYLLTKDNHVAMAANADSDGWNSLDLIPSGFSAKAKNSVVAYSPSMLALRWDEGGKSVVQFVNTKTGAVIAQHDGMMDGNINKSIDSAESKPIMFVDNIAVDIYAKKVQTFDKKIVAIVDNIVYLEDGSSRDLSNNEPAWTENQNGEAPFTIFQRQAFYLRNGSMYLINVKYVPAANEPSKTPSAKGK